MNKISIISSNFVFAEDLKQQIERFLEGAVLLLNETNKDINLIIVDENEVELKKIVTQYTEVPVVFLSSEKDSSENADLVIKKPLKLYDFLNGLKNHTLLPKVRRKECANFKEYSFYPVKKEIFSNILNKTFKLTEKEVSIIKYLYQNANKITEKEELLENVWEYSADATTHTVETHIYRLRQKVEQDGGSQLIITENNGYRLNI